MPKFIDDLDRQTVESILEREEAKKLRRESLIERLGKLEAEAEPLGSGSWADFWNQLYSTPEGRKKSELIASALKQRVDRKKGRKQ